VAPKENNAKATDARNVFEQVLEQQRALCRGNAFLPLGPRQSVGDFDRQNIGSDQFMDACAKVVAPKENSTPPQTGRQMPSIPGVTI
jgi:hypothetical protein